MSVLKTSDANFDNQVSLNELGIMLRAYVQPETYLDLISKCL